MVGDLYMFDGIYLFKDIMIFFFSYLVQVDKDIYGDDVFDCDFFWFSRMREVVIVKGELELNVSFLMISYDFLLFGYGKYVCFGWYLLDFELKMILVYIL